MNTFTYNGYTGQCEVDTEAGMIFGRVIDINDVITFQSETVAGAREEFEKSIEVYLDFCRELGEEPAKPYSGKILYRTTPERHRQLVVQARRQGTSLNAWLNEVVARELKAQPQSQPSREHPPGPSPSARRAREIDRIVRAGL